MNIKLVKMAKRVKFDDYKLSFFGLEEKYHDSGRNKTFVNSSSSMAGLEQDPGTDNCLNGIAQGDTESRRDGRKYSMTSAVVQGNLELTAYQTLFANITDLDPVTVFVALVLDKQTNGTQLNSEDVFSNPNGSTDTGSCPYKNMKFKNRFEILDMRKYAINQGAMASDGTNFASPAVVRYFELSSPLNVTVNCNGTGSTVADIIDNSLHVIAGADKASTVRITYSSRVRFVG